MKRLDCASNASVQKGQPANIPKKATPRKIPKSMKKVQKHWENVKKKRAKRKYLRPKTDIHLEPSLDVQKSTIYENGLAKRPPK